MHEYNKIIKSIRLIHKTDYFEISIALGLESTTQEPPKMGTSKYTMDGTLGIIHGFPTVKEASKSDFFYSNTLLFRLLQRALELHLVNPIKSNDMTSVPFSNDVREDSRLFEYTVYSSDCSSVLPQAHFLIIFDPCVSIEAVVLTESTRLIRKNIQNSCVHSEKNKCPLFRQFDHSHTSAKVFQLYLSSSY